MEAAQAVGVARIVYTSSVAALGLHDDGTPADEATSSSLADMIGPYKRSKFLAEEAVRGGGAGNPYNHLAILPYPARYEQVWPLPGGGE